MAQASQPASGSRTGSIRPLPVAHGPCRSNRRRDGRARFEALLGESFQRELHQLVCAFEHLLANNTKYDDDGKENILDDYCALMAATELWISTNNSSYRDEARKRAGNLNKRMSDRGYFIANDGNRPFWHASDAAESSSLPSI